MFTKTLETERLLLRPFTMEDVLPTFEMESHPDISKYTHDGGVKSLEQIQQLISHLIEYDYHKHGFGRFALELKSTGEFIGFSGLKYLEDIKEVDLGYRIRRDLWGQGLATESCQAALDFGFNQLKLQQILAFIIPDNIGSKRVLEKLNFTYDSQFFEENIEIHQYILKKISVLLK